ncbi:plastid-lipid-associated protein [Quercus suber]|uniref:Plastid-lipid-associated protein n=1 Tax=Quercus suber TaxID=58331 RepID=A0AAW0K152_QUESU|nr:plastid-lipid-associated protein, chloroplastic [Quercus suber]
MAFVSQLSQFTLLVVTPQTQFTPRASVFAPNFVKIGVKRVEKTRIWTGRGRVFGSERGGKRSWVLRGKRCSQWQWWRYTSLVGLFPLLSRGALPLVTVEEISQIIDSENVTVQNIVQFAGPLATTSISASAKFEVRSPKSVQIKFEEGIIIGTPQLTDSLVIPENVEILGQKIDLTPFKGLLNSVQDTASSVAKTISSQPPLKFFFSNSNTESWLLTTYLDEELRISMEDGGSVFFLIKEGSSLLTA